MTYFRNEFKKVKSLFIKAFSLSNKHEVHSEVYSEGKSLHHVKQTLDKLSTIREVSSFSKLLNALISDKMEELSLKSPLEIDNDPCIKCDGKGTLGLSGVIKCTDCDGTGITPSIMESMKKLGQLIEYEDVSKNSSTSGTIPVDLFKNNIKLNELSLGNPRVHQPNNSVDDTEFDFDTYLSHLSNKS